MDDDDDELLVIEAAFVSIETCDDDGSMPETVITSAPRLPLSSRAQGDTGWIQLTFQAGPTTTDSVSQHPGTWALEFSFEWSSAAARKRVTSYDLMWCDSRGGVLAQVMRAKAITTRQLLMCSEPSVHPEGVILIRLCIRNTELIGDSSDALLVPTNVSLVRMSKTESDGLQLPNVIVAHHSAHDLASAMSWYQFLRTCGWPDGDGGVKIECHAPTDVTVTQLKRFLPRTCILAPSASRTTSHLFPLTLGPSPEISTRLQLSHIKTSRQSSVGIDTWTQLLGLYRVAFSVRSIASWIVWPDTRHRVNEALVRAARALEKPDSDAPFFSVTLGGSDDGAKIAIVSDGVMLQREIDQSMSFIRVDRQETPASSTGQKSLAPTPDRIDDLFTLLRWLDVDIRTFEPHESLGGRLQPQTHPVLDVCVLLRANDSSKDALKCTQVSLDALRDSVIAFPHVVLTFVIHDASDTDALDDVIQMLHRFRLQLDDSGFMHVPSRLLHSSYWSYAIDGVWLRRFLLDRWVHAPFVCWMHTGHVARTFRWSLQLMPLVHDSRTHACVPLVQRNEKPAFASYDATVYRTSALRSSTAFFAYDAEHVGFAALGEHPSTQTLLFPPHQLHQSPTDALDRHFVTWLQLEAVQLVALASDALH